MSNQGQADQNAAQGSQVGPSPSLEAPRGDGLRALAPSPNRGTPSLQSRAPYVPQFSAATEMILKRIKNEPSNLSSAVSSAAVVGRFNQTAYEDTRRRLVMNMNTSLTMAMPASTASSMPMPVPSGLQSSPFPPLRPAPPRNEVAGAGPSTAASAAPTSSTPRSTGKSQAKRSGKPLKGTKRKRGKENEDASSDPSDLTDSGEDSRDQATPTTTKSGRQVLKPNQFNPATNAGSAKKKHYGKRTPEQALCKVCTRGLSPASNQIVFCDGCNSCWHQLCHDPYIDDEFVSDEARSWFCRTCLAKKEKHLAKKRTLDGFKGTSWAAKAAEQKRTYLNGLSHQQLLNVIMYSIELHPDLPIFPQEEPRSTKKAAQGLFAGSSTDGLFARAEASSSGASGPANFSPQVSTSGKPGDGQRSTAEEAERETREDSVESVPPAWPKAGQGCLKGLQVNEADLRDENDFEAFSVMTYDNAGQKIIENGVAISQQPA